jgi:hypothetical protein
MIAYVSDLVRELRDCSEVVVDPARLDRREAVRP